MRNKITIQDLAKELNLTAATVSRALNNHPRISLSTKRSVSDLAEKLNYRRNHLASSLRLGKSHTIGVIIPRADINFFGSVIHGIESIANVNGYHIFLYQSNESPSYEIQAIESFIGAKVDGILASIAKETSDFSHYLDLKKRGIPLVFFDRSKESLEIPSVVIDDFKGGFLATKHLVAEGYKRIAHISGQQHLKIFRDRLSGYMAALEECGFTVDRSLIYNGDVSIEAGKNAMEYFFSLAHPPDAVFAVEDFTALGVIKAAKERRINIPGQLGVIGFANEPFGEHITPGLSSIDQQTIEMGKEAFKLLLDIINSTGVRPVESPTVVLEPIPFFRESSLKNSKTLQPIQTPENMT
ncbi:MAG TPA: LacI family DNA-binding transcriptional regulator [Chitinophagaceae bacterium]|nr:LacI family DNA-binding transcriptional regulator [Chitinophagaceae bacterium]